jgi:hypothetical protein
MSDDVPMETLAETENFEAYVTDDPDDGEIFHIDLGRLTLHLFREEWHELVDLIKAASKKTGK